MNESLPDNVKSGVWIFRTWEDMLRPKLAPYIPSWIETYHLTLLSIIWSLGVIIAGMLAYINSLWLILTIIMIACQYITDLMDGTIGRLRNTGLVKWGYFMDHFLDFVFFTSLILSLSSVFPTDSFGLIVIIALIQIGFMINIFLSYNAKDTFTISFAGFGPTEIRLLYILLNLFIIFFGASVLEPLLAPFAIIVGTALCINVYLTQKTIWKLDMEHHNSAQQK